MVGRSPTDRHDTVDSLSNATVFQLSAEDLTGWAELQMQLGESPHLPGRLVGEAPCTRPAVVFLADSDIGHPIEDAVERDAPLGPGQIYDANRRLLKRPRQRAAAARARAGG